MKQNNENIIASQVGLRERGEAVPPYLSWVIIFCIIASKATSNPPTQHTQMTP